MIKYNPLLSINKFLDYYEDASLYMATITDPAINAAVLTTIIDVYDGIVISLTAAGNSQTLQSPTIVTPGKPFTVVSDDSNGIYEIDVNGITLLAGEAQRFIWDGTAWCSLKGGVGATNTTKLSATGTIAAGTNFLTTASGTSYTFSGDAGNLLASAAVFGNAEYIAVILNGLYLIKGNNVTWQSQTSFQLDLIVDSGDEIIIIS